MDSAETEPSQPNNDLFGQSGPQNSCSDPQNDNHSDNQNGRKKKHPGGRPIKATPELVAKICEYLAKGLSEDRAAAVARVSLSTLKEWKKEDWFKEMLARAEGEFILGCLAKAEKDYKHPQRHTWPLEHIRRYRDEYGDPAKLTIHAQQHNWTLPEEKAREIHDREARLTLELKNEQETHNSG